MKKKINIIKIGGRPSTGFINMNSDFKDYLDYKTDQLYAIEFMFTNDQKRKKRSFRLVHKHEYLNKLKDWEENNIKEVKRTNWVFHASPASNQTTTHDKTISQHDTKSAHKIEDNSENTSDNNISRNKFTDESKILHKELIKIFENSQIKTKALSINDINSLLTTFHPSNHGIMLDEAVLELVYGSGLRVNEINNLTINDVCLSKGLINVKSHNGFDRNVPISNKSIPVLKRYLKNSHNFYVKQSSPDSFFLTNRGTAFSSESRSLELRIIKRAKLLNIKDVTLKILRDTSAIHMLNNGINENDFMAIMGIEDDEELLNYLNCSPERKIRNYVNVLNIINKIRK